MNILPDIIQTPSPNHGERCMPYDRPRFIVLHYTDMIPFDAALQRMCDPVAEVSAHYAIGMDGTIHRLVAEDRRAWHAGRSRWQGIDDMNSASIGIELDNPGHSHGLIAFPDAQIAALTALCRDIMARHAIPAANVIGHSDIAPGRKADPGPLFPWRTLAREGIGSWLPDEDIVTILDGADIAERQALLSGLGYDCLVSGEMDAPTAAALDAFKLHYASYVIRS